MKILALTLGLFLAQPSIATKFGLPPSPGCCAGHNGVCGCYKASGYYQCCDGAASPMCKCVEPEDPTPKPPPPPPPTPTPWVDQAGNPVTTPTPKPKKHFLFFW